MKDIDTVREEFSRDVYATQTTGIILEDARPGYSQCSVKLDKRHLNGVGAVMGGAIYTLADFAFAVASNYEQMNTQTLTSQITYLSAVKGERLIARAYEIKRGRSTCYYQIDIEDDTGRKIACVATTGFITAN